MSVENHQIARFGNFEFDIGQEELRRAGRMVRLSPQPAKLLALLISRAGRVVTREEIQQVLWPDGTYVDFEQGINHTVRQLRTALGDDAASSRWIQTLPRVGYRFFSGVEVLESALEPVPANGNGANNTSGATGNGHSTAPAGSTVAPGRNPGRRPLVIVGSVAATALIAVAILLGFELSSSPRSPVGNEPALPFGEIRLSQVTSNIPVNGAALSPDGRYIAISQVEEGGSGLHVRSLVASTAIRVVDPDPYPLRDLSYSPDGEKIYFLKQEEAGPGYSTLFSVPSLGGPVRKLLFDVDAGVTFSPDGGRMAFIRGVPSEMKTLLITANTDGTDEKVLAVWQAPGIFAQVNPGWSPDGKWIAVATWISRVEAPFTIYLVNTTTGTMQGLGGRWDALSGLAWLPDGTGLIIMAVHPGEEDRGQAWLLSYPDGQPRRVSNDLGSYVDLSMAADGKSFVTVRREMKADLWTITPGDAESWKRWTTRFKPEDTIHFLARVDGDNVVFVTRQDDGFRLWRLEEAGGDPVPLIPESSPAPQLVYPSRDGKTLVYMQSDANEMMHVYSVASAGGTPSQVTFGEGESRPSFCGNDRVLFIKTYEPGLYSTSLSGSGREEKVTDLTPYSTFAHCTSDERFIVFDVSEPTGTSSHRSIVVIPAEGGEPVHRHLFPDGRLLRWSEGRNTLTFVSEREVASNLYTLDIETGEVEQLTHIDRGGIFAYDWSADGNTAYLSHGGIETTLVHVRQAGHD